MPSQRLTQPSVNDQMIPDFLPNRFLNWRMIEGRKVPCRRDGTRCDAHDPANHVTYAEASAAGYGVAYDIRAEDRLFMLDLDKCLLPDGQWSPEAVAIFESFKGAWGEVSQSGTGLHIIGRCDPSRLNDRKNKWSGWLEFYVDGRFIAFGRTGWQVIGGGTATGQDWTDQLLRVVPEREHLGELPEGVDPAYTGPADDDALIVTMLRSAGGAGAKFEMKATVGQLWNADAAVLSKLYPAFDGGGGFDHSSADAALMAHLAFWTGKDMPRMDRLFRRSALMREKYEIRADYRRDTVQNAARLCRTVYDRPVPLTDLVVMDDHRRSKFYSAAGLVGKPVPPREWLVPDLVPSRTVTLLGGDGGTGKSLLALQLACAVATDGTWLGRSVAGGRALFISAEDDEGELHRRLADVVMAGGATFDGLDRLTLRSLAGEDALLATLDRSGGVLHITPLLSEIDKRIADEFPALVVLDTLADMFPGNENDRAQARHFIGILRGIANRHGCAVLLLAHPSLTGMSTGAGTSGSTAWNNSVRSRLYLDRVADNPDARLLSTKKANYGRIGEEISMTWRAGIFVADSLLGSNGKIADEAKAERVFLRLLDDFTKEGRTVKSAQAHGYAPKVFAASGRTEGLSKQVLISAMERLFAKREIVETLGGHTSPSKQTMRIVRAKVIWGAEPMPNPPAEPHAEPPAEPVLNLRKTRVLQDPL